MGFKWLSLKFLLVVPVVSMLLLPAGEAMAGTYQTNPSERFNMSYIYFGSSVSYTKYVDAAESSLNHISPSYFDLNEDGTLKLTMATDQNFINAMHSKGIKVTPFLSNHWNRQKGINALKNREQLSAQIAEAILQYNLDGVNVDIENVTEEERAYYTDFVRLLSEKLPGKSISVAVAPNPYHSTTGWYGSYDFAELAKYSDYLMLMAYDEHYQGGPAGPVAGYPFTEKTIQAALKYVPADKLVLGIPFYGRLWKQGSSYGGYGISNSKVEELIEKYNGKVIYDYVQKSPRAVITIRPEDIKPTVFGSTLEAGKYDIWYENEASIKRKLELVGKYNLKGTGSWSLGQESGNTWDYYSLWLDGRYFNDIQSHWAKASIISALDQGWMKGMSGTQFMPNTVMTRAQAATLLVRALDINTAEAGQTRSSFTDIEGHWARKEIEAAVLYGLVEGVGNGKFQPDKTLTREQMAVMLDRVLKIDSQPTAQFHDVTPASSPWSHEAVNRMAAAGLLEGFKDGGFYPKDGINRGQMAVLMERSFPYFSDRVILAIKNEGYTPKAGN